MYLQLVPVGADGKGPVLHRQKRNWISAPRHLKENQDYTGLLYIARVCPLLLHCLTVATDLSDILPEQRHGCHRNDRILHLQDLVSWLNFDKVT